MRSSWWRFSLLLESARFSSNKGIVFDTSVAIFVVDVHLLFASRIVDLIPVFTANPNEACHSFETMPFHYSLHFRWIERPFSKMYLSSIERFEEYSFSTTEQRVCSLRGVRINNERCLTIVHHRSSSKYSIQFKWNA